ncbi:MAG: hypothetical protein JNK87_24945 [Bryobacterales bacterium]|nr:hypothetical protein [Bryobacterales bacterium]
MYYAEAFGLYPDPAAGERAVERLRLAGFDEIDLATQENVNENLLPGNQYRNQRRMEAVYGAIALGILIGGAFGFFIGYFAGLAGAVTGAVAGATAAGVLGMVLADPKEKKHERFMKNGGVRLTVRCPSGEPVERAADILRQTGARELGVTTSTRAPMSGS